MMGSVDALQRPSTGFAAIRQQWRTCPCVCNRPLQIIAAAPALVRADSLDQTLATQTDSLPNLSTIPEERVFDAATLQRKSGGYQNGIVSEDLSRLSSNGYASTSAPSFSSSSPNEVFLAELKACDHLEDVMEMAVEESASMGGAWISASLLRCVAIVKAHRQKKQGKLQGVENGQALAVLLQLVQREGSKMTASDLVMCLWSLATMKTKVLRVLKTLQKEIDVRVLDLSEREMALAIWSFATLNHHPGVLASRIGDEAVNRISKFQPQGLSMMMWAFGKLEHVPSAEFLGGVVSMMYSKIAIFSPQSIANITHAAGKLKYQLSLAVCQSVEKTIAKDPKLFKDIELANILYAFVKARYRSTTVVTALEQRIAARDVGFGTLATVFGTLCWGAGVLGMQLQAQTCSALGEWGLREMKDKTAISICNIAWGLSKQGMVDQPAFAATLQLVVECHEQKPLEPRLMRQLFQAVTSARLQGIAPQIPEDLEKTAHKWWRKTSLSNTMSVTNGSVAKAVRTLGLVCQSQHTPAYGMPVIDVAIERENEKSIAVLVVTPYEFTINGTLPMGRILSNTKLLEAAGWHVLVLNATELKDVDNEPQVISIVGRLLETAGLQTSWEECADKAERPAPAGIRNHKSRATVDIPMPATAEQRRLSSLDMLDDSDDEEFDSDSDLEEPSASRQSNGRPQNGVSNVGSQHANGVQSKVGGVSLRMDQGSKLSAAIEQKSLKQESPQEQRERAQKVTERKKYVATQLTGDFMEGWESLSGWTAMKKVQPTRRQ